MRKHSTSTYVIAAALLAVGTFLGTWMALELRDVFGAKKVAYAACQVALCLALLLYCAAAFKVVQALMKKCSPDGDAPWRYIFVGLFGIVTLMIAIGVIISSTLAMLLLPQLS